MTSIQFLNPLCPELQRQGGWSPMWSIPTGHQPDLKTFVLFINIFSVKLFNENLFLCEQTEEVLNFKPLSKCPYLCYLTEALNIRKPCRAQWEAPYTWAWSHLQFLDRLALLLTAPHSHPTLIVAARPSISAQTLVLEGGEVRVVRDLHWHLRSATNCLMLN